MSTKFSFCGYRCCCFLTEKRKQIPGALRPIVPWTSPAGIQAVSLSSTSKKIIHWSNVISREAWTRQPGPSGEIWEMSKWWRILCHQPLEKMIHMSNPIIQHVVCTTLQLKNLAEKVTFWRDMIAKLLNGYCQKGASCWCKIGCKLCRHNNQPSPVIGLLLGYPHYQ